MKTPKPSNDDRAFKARIDASDKRINAALDLLCDSERGRRVLGAFKQMCDAGATGLDMANLRALQTLIREMANGRRDFLSDITVVAGEHVRIRV